MSSQKPQDDKEFEEKLKKAFYKTSNKDYGSASSQCNFALTIVSSDKEKGINGKFTDVSLSNSASPLLWNVQKCKP